MAQFNALRMFLHANGRIFFGILSRTLVIFTNLAYDVGEKWDFLMNRLLNLVLKLVPAKNRWIAKEKIRLSINALKRAGQPGNNVVCDCCGNRFGAFDSVPPRGSQRCARCRAGERQRLLTIFFEQRGMLKKRPLKVLHVAPEYVLRQQFIKEPGLEYVTSDILVGNAEYIANLEDLPFADGPFNFILCCHVLEHVDHDQVAMKELHRGLSDGGTAIIMVPFNKSRPVTYEDPSITDPKERLKHFGQEDHVREYGLDLVDRLQNAGFAVETVYADQVVPRDQWGRHGLMEEEIFVCTKGVMAPKTAAVHAESVEASR